MTAIVDGMSENTSNFNEGDKVEVTRGKHKGVFGTVVAVDGDAYVVRPALGGFCTVNSASLKAPAERVLTKSEYDKLHFEHENADDLLDAIARHFTNETPAF